MLSFPEQQLYVTSTKAMSVVNDIFCFEHMQKKPLRYRNNIVCKNTVRAYP